MKTLIESFKLETVTHNLLGFEISRNVLSTDASNGNFDDDKQKQLRIRYEYKVTHGGKSCTFEFWGSIAEREAILSELIPNGKYKYCKRFNRDYEIVNEMRKVQKRELERVRGIDYCAGAFYCFLSDCISGDMTFNDFCGEFGYDEDSKRAERIYFACQKSLSDFRKVYRGDIYELIEQLQEVYNL